MLSHLCSLFSVILFPFSLSASLSSDHASVAKRTSRILNTKTPHTSQRTHISTIQHVRQFAKILCNDGNHSHASHASSAQHVRTCVRCVTLAALLSNSPASNPGERAAATCAHPFQ